MGSKVYTIGMLTYIKASMYEVKMRRIGNYYELIYFSMFDFMFVSVSVLVE